MKGAERRKKASTWAMSGLIEIERKKRNGERKRKRKRKK